MSNSLFCLYFKGEQKATRADGEGVKIDQKDGQEDL